MGAEPVTTRGQVTLCHLPTEAAPVQERGGRRAPNMREGGPPASLSVTPTPPCEASVRAGYAALTSARTHLP